MAVVREYVESSPDTGFYLRDRFNGDFITYQVSGTANSLLRKLGYAHGETLDSEVFQLLHRLELVYTHNSGIEPPGSLLEIESISQEGARKLKEGDREMLLTYLLESDQLRENEKKEIQEYAQERGIELGADENSSTGSNTAASDEPSATSQDENQAQNYDNTQTEIEIEIDKSGATTRFDSLTVRCEYCDEAVEAAEYIGHVGRHSGSHGEPGTLPSGFIPGDASIEEWGEVDILYQDDLSKTLRYYPICRWCGKRFYRLASFMIHLQSNRDSFDASLHQRAVEQFGRPLLLPVDEHEVAVSRSRLSGEVTDVALEELDSQLKVDSTEASPGKHIKKNNEANTRTGGAYEADAVVASTGESDGRRGEGDQELPTFPERVEDYERSWLLTDTARFFDLLSKYADATEAEERRLARHHEGILEHAQDVYNRARDLEGSLEQYKSEWGAPEQGVKIPRSLLEDLGIGDYRGDIFFLEGYPIPLQHVFERVMHAELEQSSLSGDPESIVVDIFNDSASEPQSVETDSLDSEDDQDNPESNTSAVQSPSDTPVEAGESDGLIPTSVIKDVLMMYRMHEDERREASWFHASEILQNRVNEETGLTLELDDVESDDESDPA